ncbi:hypothetical protein PFISCL1PPCAC_8130, partial [Pristionchus fissidentatus]
SFSVRWSHVKCLTNRSAVFRRIVILLIVLLLVMVIYLVIFFGTAAVWTIKYERRKQLRLDALAVNRFV